MFEHHQCHHQQHGAKGWQAEPEPAARHAPVSGGQLGLLRQRLGRQSLHADLQPDHRQPAGAGEHIEREADGDPVAAQRVTGERGHGQAADGLENHRGRGEQPVGQHHVPVGHCHVAHIAAAVGHPLVEGAAQSGSEQQHHAQDVQGLEGGVAHGRLPRIEASSYCRCGPW